MASTNSSCVTPFSRALARWDRSWSGRFIAMRTLTVIRLRSRGDSSGRAHTSPNSTLSVSSANLGEMSPNILWASVGCTLAPAAGELATSFFTISLLCWQLKRELPQVAVLLVGDFLHPVDHLPVEFLLD